MFPLRESCTVPNTFLHPSKDIKPQVEHPAAICAKIKSHFFDCKQNNKAAPVEMLHPQFPTKLLSNSNHNFFPLNKYTYYTEEASNGQSLTISNATAISPLKNDVKPSAKFPIVIRTPSKFPLFVKNQAQEHLRSLIDLQKLRCRFRKSLCNKRFQVGQPRVPKFAHVHENFPFMYSKYSKLKSFPVTRPQLEISTADFPNSASDFNNNTTYLAIYRKFSVDINANANANANSNVNPNNTKEKLATKLKKTTMTQWRDDLAVKCGNEWENQVQREQVHSENSNNDGVSLNMESLQQQQEHNDGVLCETIPSNLLLENRAESSNIQRANHESLRVLCASAMKNIPPITTNAIVSPTSYTLINCLTTNHKCSLASNTLNNEAVAEISQLTDNDLLGHQSHPALRSEPCGTSSQAVAQLISGVSAVAGDVSCAKVPEGHQRCVHLASEQVPNDAFYNVADGCIDRIGNIDLVDHTVRIDKKDALIALNVNDIVVDCWDNLNAYICRRETEPQPEVETKTVGVSVPSSELIEMTITKAGDPVERAEQELEEEVPVVYEESEIKERSASLSPPPTLCNTQATCVSAMKYDSGNTVKSGLTVNSVRSQPKNMSNLSGLPKASSLLKSTSATSLSSSLLKQEPNVGRVSLTSALKPPLSHVGISSTLSNLPTSSSAAIIYHSPCLTPTASSSLGSYRTPSPTSLLKYDNKKVGDFSRPQNDISRSVSFDTVNVGVTPRSRLRRQKRTQSQDADDQPENHIERLNRLKARISGALSEVKGVLKQYSTEDEGSAPPALNISAQKNEVPTKQNGSPVQFRFVRKVRRTSIFHEEEEDKEQQLAKQSVERKTNEEQMEKLNADLKVPKEIPSNVKIAEMNEKNKALSVIEELKNEQQIDDEIETENKDIKSIDDEIENSKKNHKNKQCASGIENKFVTNEEKIIDTDSLKPNSNETDIKKSNCLNEKSTDANKSVEIICTETVKQTVEPEDQKATEEKHNKEKHKVKRKLSAKEVKTVNDIQKIDKDEKKASEKSGTAIKTKKPETETIANASKNLKQEAVKEAKSSQVIDELKEFPNEKDKIVAKETKKKTPQSTTTDKLKESVENRKKTEEQGLFKIPEELTAPAKTPGASVKALANVQGPIATGKNLKQQDPSPLVVVEQIKAGDSKSQENPVQADIRQNAKGSVTETADPTKFKKKLSPKNKSGETASRRASIAAVESSKLVPPVNSELTLDIKTQRRPSDSEAVIKRKVKTTATATTTKAVIPDEGEAKGKLKIVNKVKRPSLKGSEIPPNVDDKGDKATTASAAAVAAAAAAATKTTTTTVKSDAVINNSNKITNVVPAPAPSLDTAINEILPSTTTTAVTTIRPKSVPAQLLIDEAALTIANAVVAGTAAPPTAVASTATNKNKATKDSSTKLDVRISTEVNKSISPLRDIDQNGTQTEANATEKLVVNSGIVTPIVKLKDSLIQNSQFVKHETKSQEIREEKVIKGKTEIEHSHLNEATIRTTTTLTTNSGTAQPTQALSSVQTKIGISEKPVNQVIIPNKQAPILSEEIQQVSCVDAVVNAVVTASEAIAPTLTQTTSSTDNATKAYNAPNDSNSVVLVAVSATSEAEAAINQINMPELQVGLAPVQAVQVNIELEKGASPPFNVPKHIESKKKLVFKKIVHENSINKVAIAKDIAAASPAQTEKIEAIGADECDKTLTEIAEGVKDVELVVESAPEEEKPAPPPKPPRKVKKKVIIKRQQRRLSIGDTFFQEADDKTPLSEVEIIEKPIAYVTDDENDGEDENEKHIEEPKELKTCMRPREYEVGDQVMYAERFRKTQVRWKRGVIIDRITSISYKLEVEGKEVPAHVSYIKRYIDRKVNFSSKEYLEINYEQIAQEEKRARIYSIWNMV